MASDTQTENGAEEANQQDTPMENGLEQAIRHLIFPSDLETVYIAIDVTNLDNTSNSSLGKQTDTIPSMSHTQAGISIFDPRELNPASPAPALATYNYATGLEPYYKNELEKFSFGKAEWIHPGSMLENINRHIPQDRNVVLVFNLAERHLKALRRIGFGLNSSVLGFLDTRSLAKEVDMGGAGVKRLVEHLGYVPHRERSYNAGSYANFALRAVILLALEKYEKRQRIDVQQMLSQVPLWRRSALRTIGLDNNIYVKPKTLYISKNQEKMILTKTDVLESELECESKLPVTKVHDLVDGGCGLGGDNEWELIDDSELIDSDEWELIHNELIHDDELLDDDAWEIINVEDELARFERKQLGKENEKYYPF